MSTILILRDFVYFSGVTNVISNWRFVVKKSRNSKKVTLKLTSIFRNYLFMTLRFIQNTSWHNGGNHRQIICKFDNLNVVIYAWVTWISGDTCDKISHFLNSYFTWARSVMTFQSIVNLVGFAVVSILSIFSSVIPLTIFVDFQLNLSILSILAILSISTIFSNVNFFNIKYKFNSI